MSGVTASYSYDGDDVRVSQTTSGLTSWYLWDRASGLPLLIDDGAYGYVHAGGAQAQIDSNGTTDWLLADGLGSIRGVTDANQTLTGTSSYAAFGDVRSQTGVGSVFGFASEQTDPATGNQYLRARYHDPTTGRFLSADTVQPNAPGSQGFNRYSYTANNPATFTDPNGHYPEGTLQQAGLSLIGVTLRLSQALVAQAAATAPLPVMPPGSLVNSPEWLRIGAAIQNVLRPLLGVWTASGIVTYLGAGPARFISAALYVFTRVLVFVVLYLVMLMFVLLDPWEYFTDARPPSAITMPEPALVRLARWDHPRQPNWNNCAQHAAKGVAEELAWSTAFMAVGGAGVSATDLLLAAGIACMSGGSGGGKSTPPNPSWINPEWGQNRLVKELYNRGFQMVRPTNSGGGLLYRNAATGEEIRIMPRPTTQFRNDPPAKHLSQYYFRYRSGPDQPWGPLSSIPDK